MSIVFGLDFGTTNSALAVSRDDEIEIIDVDPESPSPKILKSVLFFDEDKNVAIGQEAIDQYVEYHGMYGRFMQSIKTFLPNRSFRNTFVFGKRFGIEDLVALILREMKHRGELYVGHVVDTVVLGRPVIFSENKENDLLAEERLRTAALKAGFLNIHFLYEPIAATLAYEAALSEEDEKLVFMGDFGGGTSDFVVMRLRGGKRDPKKSRKNDILAVGGVYIGGGTFDGAIMWNKVAKYFGKNVKYKSSTGKILDMPVHIPRTLCQWHLIPQLRDKDTLQSIRSIKATSDDRQSLENLETLILENLGYMVFQSIEKSKCELSDSKCSRICFSERDISIKERITKQEFESMITDEVAKIKRCVDDVFYRAGVSEKDIDVVLLTGGSSFVPIIKNLFIEKFGAERIHPVDAFTSVAYGLGLSSTMY